MNACQQYKDCQDGGRDAVVMVTPAKFATDCHYSIQDDQQRKTYMVSSILSNLRLSQERRAVAVRVWIRGEEVRS